MSTEMSTENTRTYPTLEQALAKLLPNPSRSHRRENVIRDWFNYMQASGWRDKQGHPILDWEAYFYVWRKSERKLKREMRQMDREEEQMKQEWERERKAMEELHARRMAMIEEMKVKFERKMKRRERRRLERLRKWREEHGWKDKHTPPRADNYVRANEESIARFKATII